MMCSKYNLTYKFLELIQISINKCALLISCERSAFANSSYVVTPQDGMT